MVLAFDHSLEDTLYTIDGDDGDILARFETCSFNSLDSTQSHIIVLSKEDIDLIAIGFEEGFHNFLALLTSELTRLGSKKVVFASILGSSHSILEAFLTADCYGRTNSALELYDIEFIAASRFLVVLSHVLVDPLEDLFAFSNGVRADLGYIEGIIADLYITVNNDNRDLCVLSFFKNCIPARLYNRDKGDDINALGNEGTNCFDLIFLFLLRIRELKIYTGILSSLLDRFRICGSPFGFRTDLREAHRNLLIALGTGAGAVLFGLVSAATANDHKHHGCCQHQRNNLFHLFNFLSYLSFPLETMNSLFFTCLV